MSFKYGPGAGRDNDYEALRAEVTPMYFWDEFSTDEQDAKSRDFVRGVIEKVRRVQRLEDADLIDGWADASDNVLTNFSADLHYVADRLRALGAS